MMVPRVDEAVAVGGRWIVLSGAEYNDGRVEGEGGRYLKDFRWDCQTPVWLFEIEGHRLESASSLKQFLTVTMVLMLSTLTIACADRYDRTSYPSWSTTYSEQSMPSILRGPLCKGFVKES
jgi:hypothetical protein